MSTPFNYKWLEPGAAIPVDIETTAALVKELTSLVKAAPRKYMVSVCGASAPSHIHRDLTEAMKEAERLSRIRQNFDRTIHVVEIKNSLVPRTTHEWEDV